MSAWLGALPDARTVCASALFNLGQQIAKANGRFVAVEITSGYCLDDFLPFGPIALGLEAI